MEIVKNVVDVINELLEINDSYQAPSRLWEILYDRPRREALFLRFLDAFNYDVSYDWFHEYFQEEHADRKKKKQDFTPNELSDLLSMLVGAGKGVSYDVAAGTGGITIRKWHADRLKTSPFFYRPSDYFYVCEELSDRAVPFLLFNLLIRGMNAVVLHGDTLTRTKVKGVFFVQNDTDDHMRFSSLNLMPYSEAVAREFMITSWACESDRHKPIKETKEFPTYLIDRIAKEAKEANIHI